MKVDGRLNKIVGDVGEISVVTCDQSIRELQNNTEISDGQGIGGKKNTDQLVITDSKRKRLDEEINIETNKEKNVAEEIITVGPKKLAKGGTCFAGPPIAISLLA